MADANSTSHKHEVSAGKQSGADTFITTAIRKMPWGRDTIHVGDDLFVDKTGIPQDGDLVFVGGDVEPWCGQDKIAGVVVYIGRCRVPSVRLEANHV